MFREINEAMGILGDKAKRKQHDRERETDDYLDTKSDRRNRFDEDT